MIRNKTGIYIITILLLMATACSNTKNLPAGDSLFVGSKVRIKDNEASKRERKVLVNDLAGAVRPKPNTKTLGMRLKLRIYNFAGETKKKKGLKAWLRNKVGEPPVLASTLNLQTNTAIMTNLLQNRGFFFAKVHGSTETNKKRKTTAIFDVTTGSQYFIDTTVLVMDSTRISSDIDSDFNQTLLTQGAPFNLDLIKGERNRIDNSLKERGYYYFRPDYVIVKADSTVGNHKVKLYVALKTDSIPEEAYHVYNINDIYIYPNYRLHGKEKDTDKNNAILYDGYHIVDVHHTFKPLVFSQVMQFQQGDEYSLDDQNNSLSRLVNLGTFKYVKNRFENLDDTALNVYYYLTQYPKKALQFQIGALTQNDNRAGTQGSISWKNRNTFKGAEELVFKINGGFEAQYSGIVKQPNIYNVGAEADLSFPRFVVPFLDIQTSSMYMPRTLIKLSYNYESESDLLRINSYKASYGYDWKESPMKEHQFYPINFTYVKTDTLGNADRLGLLYGNLIFDGIILGPTYEYTYNSQIGPPKISSFYFDGLIDLSGNILGLAQHADYKTDPKTIFGSRYAQYIKLQPDFRYYLRFARNNNTILANRIMVGVGIPYGNSESLPNVKQFWAGGNSDLRGFPSRLVGPGTYNEYSLYHTNKYLETLGDMKFEFNTELRQNIYKFLNAAVFFDMGNIWLYNDNPAYPGGKFTSQFYKELAADVGVGLRFDFKILILRLDLGMPVREPWLDPGDRWVFKQIDFGDPTWRKNNLVLNIGIGYPF